MKIIQGIAFLTLALSAFACGGVDDDLLLKDLDSAQISDLCSEVTTETKDCGGGATASRDASKCSSSTSAIPDSCAATVGDFRTCNEADVCEFISNSGCMKLAQCAGSP